MNHLDKLVVLQATRPGMVTKEICRRRNKGKEDSCEIAFSISDHLVSQYVNSRPYWGITVTSMNDVIDTVWARLAAEKGETFELPDLGETV